ncbi:ABC-2 type transport system permease protein [Streptomyces olivoverticillatus]|uniref:ABC-2 type transport system permease protein n=1 Tax=Streptomyces olivoverticillatus TaxID=66427 RepID=A0A7W7LPH9_9ACTN|nr:ABC transporter permease [Streptomyces olivoverticillatus]MBB4893879.1 ABC-2 type transport system permease protein [Streptomyces olivoverticillatus]
MATETASATGTGVPTGTTTAAGRALALGRAELTLLGRNRMALYTVLLTPVLVIYAVSSGARKLDLSGSGMSFKEATMTGAFGYVLIFVVYCNLMSVFTARREELVLKRLRTGEAGDLEILAGTALPSLTIAVAQCALLVTAGMAWLHMRIPARPDLLVAGVLLGLALLTPLAAACTAFTKSSETAQLAAMPLVMVSMLGSGMFCPLEAMPDALAKACSLLPMTPVVQLMRDGWLGGASTAGTLGHLGAALAWTAVAVFAVRRWFRWEPRR